MSDPVLDLIQKKGLEYKVSGQDYLIKCLNPKHEDSNPSFRVDKITGISHCFSCGFKTNIFKHFGITNNFISIKVAKLKDKLLSIGKYSQDLEFPCEVTPMTRPFRSISSKTLQEFGAFYTYDKPEFEDRIFFPLKDITGKTVVYLGRHTLSDVQPRYMIYPKGVKVPLYPVKFAEKTKHVVFVEGIFDMLNLYDKGLGYVVCTFGTNTLYKDLGTKLLPLRAQGIQKIYLLFDGDEAGRNAMNELQPLIEEAGFLVEQIKLPDGSDPGDLDQDSVTSIKDYIIEKSSNY